MVRLPGMRVGHQPECLLAQEYGDGGGITVSGHEIRQAVTVCVPNGNGKREGPNLEPPRGCERPIPPAEENRDVVG